MNLQNVRNTFETARTIPGGGPFFILRSSRVPAKRVFHRLIPLSGPIQSDETGRNRAAFHLLIGENWGFPSALNGAFQVSNAWNRPP